MTKKFYATTPIYYVNGDVHVGHFYTSSIADTIAKYKKIRGFDLRFTTGVDENSQKALIIAEKENLKPMEYLDKMAGRHKEAWDFFKIDYTDFIRTTEERHHKNVRNILQKCFDTGDIYKGNYHGMYCVGCEAFKKDKDLVTLENGEKVCPDHLKVPEIIDEKNYFFKLSKYETWLLEFYEAHPDFVIPHYRFNEVIEFVKSGLEDFSISRETNTFGINLPFDESQVSYVWFDALINYHTSVLYSPINGGKEEKVGDKVFCNEEAFWPANLHAVGKDILRFHAIYWPAMLASYFDLGIEKDSVIHFQESDYKKLPQQILANGFFTLDGQKISKSLGNIIEPIEYSKEFGVEVLKLYLLNAFPIGSDGDFDRKDAILTFNAKLANNLGNLLNRIIVLSLKLDLPNFKLFSEEKFEIVSEEFYEEILESFDKFDLKNVLDKSFEALDKLNKFADETKPWEKIKNPESRENVITILYSLASEIIKIAGFLYPFFSEKMIILSEKLGVKNFAEDLESGKFDEILKRKEEFFIKEKGENLFNRIEIEII